MSCNGAGSSVEEQFQCLDIIRKMLKLNMHDRPTAVECLKSCYFSRNIPKSLDFYQPPIMPQSENDKIAKFNKNNINNSKFILNQKLDMQNFI